MRTLICTRLALAIVICIAVLLSSHVALRRRLGDFYA